MKRFCDECNRNTKHTKKKVGSEREPFFTLLNLTFTLISGGFYILLYLLTSKTNYYDIFCTVCKTGYKGIPD